jgi:hypothetical protein
MGKNSARVAFEAMFGPGDPEAVAKKRMAKEEMPEAPPVEPATNGMTQSDFTKARRPTPEEASVKQRKLAALLRSR